MIKSPKTQQFFKKYKDLDGYVRKVRALNTKIDNLILSISEVEFEHDHLAPGHSHDENCQHHVEQTLEALPVNSLKNSLDLDGGRPTGNFSLKSMKKLSMLKRKHLVLLDELDKTFSEKQVAQIELVEAKIKKINEKK